MKKKFQILVALLLIFSMTACGEFHQGNISTRPNPTVNTNPPVIDENTFTVTLLMNGQPYSPDIEMYALWTDGYSYYTAKFDENGVAAISGLDGDYTVTLSAVPLDHTYNTNGYAVSNDNRQIEINLHRIYQGTGPGTGPYYPDVYEMSEPGVYEIVIESADDVVWCRYMPKVNGIYNIESWASITEDNINPSVDIYFGSPAFITYEKTVDDGGLESSTGFTKNFKFQKDVVDEEIGNVFVFAISATAKDGKYPIVVPVVVERVSDKHNRYYRETAIVTEEIRQAPNGVGSYIPAEVPTGNGRYLLDETMFKLWPVEEGGDGYYHLYDPEKYPQHNGYGPTLYADIKAPCRNLAASEMVGDTEVSINMQLNTIEYLGSGNKMLTVGANGTFIDYKHFIEGFLPLANGGYYCVSSCTCDMVYQACPAGCHTCDPLCTTCPEGMYGAPGYADGCNSDGRYPVTEELKVFLQRFAISQGLFRDGMGGAEQQGVDSDEASQWLFACGYYSGDQGGKCPMGEKIPNKIGT